MTAQEKIRLTWLVNIAVVCLGLGIMLPVIRIDANDGTIRGFIMAFITPGPSSYSVLSSVWALIKKGVVMDILLGGHYLSFFGCFSNPEVRRVLSYA